MSTKSSKSLVPAPPEPWGAVEAQTLALRHNRPVVTRVDEEMWVIYAPIPGDLLRGGYLSEQSAEAVARRVYPNMEPIIAPRRINAPAKVVKHDDATPFNKFKAARPHNEGQATFSYAIYSLMGQKATL